MTLPATWIATQNTRRVGTDEMRHRVIRPLCRPRSVTSEVPEPYDLREVTVVKPPRSPMAELALAVDSLERIGVEAVWTRDRGPAQICKSERIASRERA
jgi:hypothetical protein